MKAVVYLMAFQALCFSHIALALQTRVNLVFDNGHAQLEQNVRLLLSIEQQKDHDLMTEGRLRRLHQKSRSEIELALQPFGYYRPRIESKLIRQPNGSWLAQYHIQPGTPIPVAQFELLLSPALMQDETFRKLVPSLQIKPGEALVHSRYEAIKSTLLTHASERGYFEAHFIRHQVMVDLQDYEARVYLNFDSGPRYKLGSINITSGILDDKLANGLITIRPGEPYLVDTLVATRQVLNDSDYFQSVDVSSDDHDLNSKSVPVNVVLKPRHNDRYSLGLGYGTDTGARIGLGWAKPLINPRGHRFRSKLKLSEIENSLSAHYSLPVLDPRTDQLTYSAEASEENTDTSRSELQTLGVSLKQGRGKWQETLSLQYQRETFSVADVRDTSLLLIPGARWSRNWGRAQVFTLDGMRIDLSVQGASEDLLADTDFMQLQAGIKFIQHLWTDNRLIARGRVGSTLTDAFDNLPSSVRFFAGGVQSVRGFAYESLGPVNETGQVEGGQHLLVGSIEIEHFFRSKWGLALFYDTGNAINAVDDSLEQGAGIGLRWRSPVGPVRIDLATALSRQGNPWRLHINIGPDL